MENDYIICRWVDTQPPPHIRVEKKLLAALLRRHSPHLMRAISFFYSLSLSRARESEYLVAHKFNELLSSASPFLQRATATGRCQPWAATHRSTTNEFLFICPSLLNICILIISDFHSRSRCSYFCIRFIHRWYLRVCVCALLLSKHSIPVRQLWEILDCSSNRRTANAANEIYLITPCLCIRIHIPISHIVVAASVVRTILALSLFLSLSDIELCRLALEAKFANALRSFQFSAKTQRLSQMKCYTFNR